MEKYIKVNAKVAKFLHLDTIRNAVKDGGYLLWMMDIQDFGRLTDLPQILTQIGGLLLTGAEAREEQDGVVNRNLPTPTDKRFIPDNEAGSNKNNQTDEGDGSNDQSAETDKGSDDQSAETDKGSDSTGGEDAGSSDDEDAADTSDKDETDLKQEGGSDE